mmetsp:Transcript_11579/g.8457  ORF Transcript_11579/g.8457 Transcript_11579/m.8457 type:complete len:224 (+) Transcript_11579:942-1613(+)
MNVDIISLYFIGDSSVHFSDRSSNDDAGYEDSTGDGSARGDHSEEVPDQEVVEHCREGEIHRIVEHCFYGLALLHEGEGSQGVVLTTGTLVLIQRVQRALTQPCWNLLALTIQCWNPVKYGCCYECECDSFNNLSGFCRKKLFSDLVDFKIKPDVKCAQQASSCPDEKGCGVVPNGRRHHHRAQLHQACLLNCEVVSVVQLLADVESEYRYCAGKEHFPGKCE